MLGLANTHDTKARVPGQLLKANQEGLQRYVNKEIGRVRKDRPPPETSHPVAKKLADQISMVLKEFSGHSFISVEGVYMELVSEAVYMELEATPKSASTVTDDTCLISSRYQSIKQIFFKTSIVALVRVRVRVPHSVRAPPHRLFAGCG